MTVIVPNRIDVLFREIEPYLIEDGAMYVLAENAPDLIKEKYNEYNDLLEEMMN